MRSNKRKINKFGLLFLIFFLGLTLQLTNVFCNNYSNKDDVIIASIMYSSTSHIYEWNQTWGGNLDDWCNGIALDSLGNIYLTGETENLGMGLDDILLIKYDSSGVQLWNCTWGGSDYEWGYEVAIDSLDNVYVAGMTLSFGPGYYDMVLVKYDSSGVQLWNRTWGGGGWDWDWGYDVVVDSTDNIYLVGERESNMALVKYDSSGVQLWNLTWNGINEGRSVAVDSFDNVYVAGDTTSFGVEGIDMILVKYDSSGVQQWYRTWGGSDNEWAEDVVVDSIGNVYITGHTSSFGEGSSDMVLVKYSSSGIQKWNKTWGGKRFDEGNAVALDSHNNIYVTGDTESYGPFDSDIILIKYNSSGFRLWNQTWRDTSEEVGYDIALDSIDNIYIGGYIVGFGAGAFDIVLLKFVSIPEIIINQPLQNEQFKSNAPDYNITIADPDLESVWYTIDNGINNYTMTQLIGTINQAAWNDVSYGDINIKFYAKDLSNYHGYSEVVIEKLKENGIPGYQLILIISIVGVITSILLKKKYN